MPRYDFSSLTSSTGTKSGESSQVASRDPNSSVGLNMSTLQLNNFTDYRVTLINEYEPYVNEAPNFVKDMTYNGDEGSGLSDDDDDSMDEDYNKTQQQSSNESDDCSLNEENFNFNLDDDFELDIQTKDRMVWGGKSLIVRKIGTSC